MTISTLAFGKANASGSLKLSGRAARFYSTAPAANPSSKTNNGPAAAAATQRELFMHVLHANATKRDAKQYLSQFKNIGENPRAEHERLRRKSLYGPSRAIAESPQFVREERDEVVATPQTVHVAVVLLRTPEKLDDATLDGVAKTLSELVKLDMRALVVIDSGDGQASAHQVATSFSDQGRRLMQAIARHGNKGARLVQGAFESVDGSNEHEVVVGVPQLLLDPLHRSIIPIVPTLAYTPSGQQLPSVAPNVMLALTHLLAGDLDSQSGHAGTSLDRILLLDEVGGIPSRYREGEAHIFINLSQEYNDIQRELAEYSREDHGQHMVPAHERHAQNLDMLQDCLALLPSASSALIITPEEAASSSRTADRVEDSIGTGTRRQKNTIIHNLLTNKPALSSSLPASRLPSQPPIGSDTRAPPRSTLVKRGMPLAIIPDADRGQGWMKPSSAQSPLDIGTDAQVDLPRLVHLIEDSFRRKLDVEDYLSRIHGRTAGLIIAGAYEGGAILTWEQPPGTSDPARLVPYLDKFAVLSSSQGSAGVADILFQAMVRTCFPHGVCWRSRKDNPVNKWYIERADGHWQIPGTNWTMFWTGEGVVENQERWEDYIGVCSSIQASWADVKKTPD